MKKSILSVLLFVISFPLLGQIEVKYFNAQWNASNEIEWVEKLTDCDIEKYDIGTKPEDAGKYKVVVVPTILIFQDGEEVERYQADISFKMSATREEIQDKIDELIMSAF
jgi:thiol-disulfide isomerase/thioredoxin